METTHDNRAGAENLFKALREHCNLTDPETIIEIRCIPSGCTTTKLLVNPSVAVLEMGRAMGEPVFPKTILLNLIPVDGWQGKAILAGAHYERNKGGKVVKAIICYSHTKQRREGTK